MAIVEQPVESAMQAKKGVFPDFLAESISLVGIVFFVDSIGSEMPTRVELWHDCQTQRRSAAGRGRSG